MDNLIIFDERYILLKDKIDGPKEWINDIVVIKILNSLDIFICHKKGINIYTLEKKHLKKKQFLKINYGKKKKNKYYENNSKDNDKTNIKGELVLLVESKNQDFYACFENKMIRLNDFTNKIISDNSIEIKNDYFLKGAIKIADFLIFKSNKIISRGKDKLFFFELNSRKFSDKIHLKEEYSFIFSSEGILKLPVEKEEINNKYKNKVLMFACKKYIKSQKNGILVLFLDNTVNDINIKDCYFY